MRPTSGTARGGHRRRAGTAVLCLATGALVGACSSSSTSSTTTTASSAGSTAAPSATLSPSQVRALQTSLARVGCYKGAVDGVVGPATMRAIRSFQAASHLTADGIAGPNTEGLLNAAAHADVRVCGVAPASTTTVTAATTTTTTSAAAASAPCTAAAISAALRAGETLDSFRCGNGWAAGSWTNSMYTAAFLLMSSNGAWTQPPANACAEAATLGIPTAVLDASPCKVS